MQQALVKQFRIALVTGVTRFVIGVSGTAAFQFRNSRRVWMSKCVVEAQCIVVPGDARTGLRWFIEHYLIDACPVGCLRLS